MAAALLGPPRQIAGPVHRKGIARQGPTLDMLAAAGNLQRLGRVGTEPRQLGAHPLAIDQRGGLAIRAARIGGVGGVDGGKGAGEGGHGGPFRSFR